MNELDFKPIDVIFPMQLNKDIRMYREPGDDDWVIRFNISPINDATRVGKNVSVAGVTFREDDANAFAWGDRQWCQLEAEPTNKYDKNAIRVLGSWYTVGKTDSLVRDAHIGYIPKEKAKLWVGKKLIAQLKTLFMPIDGRTVGIRLDVWILDDNIVQKKEDAEHSIPAPPPNFDDWG